MKQKYEEEILKNMENPIIRRALEKRCENFMFNYGDTGHSDSLGYNEYYTKSGYTEHSDYNDKWWDVYSDFNKPSHG